MHVGGNMTRYSDFGALNWVKDELDGEIRKARRNLESYVAGDAGKDALGSCIECLHKISGVLKMMEIHGPSLLADEMEAVAAALANDELPEQNDAAEALMLALIQLPDYLERLQAGDSDVPLIILPLLNDLRAVRYADLLSETAIFDPDFESVPIPTHIINQPNVVFADLVRHFRQKFEMSLLSWYKNREIDQSWQNMLEIFQELSANAGMRRSYMLASVASAFITGLIDRSITANISVKKLFGRIDQEFKRVIDNGELALENESTKRILNDLLYYIAHTDAANDSILTIKNNFELADIVPSEAELIKQREGLRGSNSELAQSVKTAMYEELIKIKDALDLFKRQKYPEASIIAQIEPALRQLADTCDLIGYSGLYSRLLKQADKVKSMMAVGKLPDDQDLMDMAADLLYFESTLNSLTASQLSDQSNQEEDEQSLVITEGEFNSFIKQTVREAQTDIQEIKELIINWSQTPAEIQHVHQLVKGMNSIVGALKLLEFMELAEITEATIKFITDQYLQQRNLTDLHQLNYLADVVSSIEYFLETLLDGAGNLREITIIARTALDELRFSVDDKANTSNVMDGIEGEHEPVEPYQIDEVAQLNEEQEYLINEYISDKTPLQDEKSALTEEIDSEILGVFIDEAREELASIQQNLGILQNNQNDHDVLINFRRSFHSLKGSGRLVGAQLIGEFSWAVENLLNRIIEGTVLVNPEIMGVLEQAVTVLPSMIDAYELGNDTDIDVYVIMRQANEFASTPTHSSTEVIEQNIIPDISRDRALSEDAGEYEQALEINNDIDSEILDVFIEEAMEEMASIEKNLLIWQQDQENDQALANFRRSFHSLKGSGRLVGAAFVADLAWSIENLLNRLIDKSIESSPEVISLLSEVVNILPNLIEAQRRGVAPDVSSEQFIRRANALTVGEIEDEIVISNDTNQKIEIIDAEVDSDKEISNSDLIIELDSELIKLFTDESESNLKVIEHFIMQAQAAKSELSVSDELTRAFHTLHGSASMTGIESIANLSELIERYLKLLIVCGKSTNETVLSLLQDALLLIRKWIQDLNDGDLSDEGMGQIAERLREQEQLLQAESISHEQLDFVQDELHQNDMGESGSSLSERSDADPGVGVEYSESVSLFAQGEMIDVNQDAELLEVFIEEAKELVEDLERAYNAWRGGMGNQKYISQMKRLLHTLKGSARLSGVTPVGDLSHALETLLARLSDRTDLVSDKVRKILRQSLDVLATQVEQAQSLGQVVSAENYIIELHSVIPASNEDNLADDLEAKLAEEDTIEEIEIEPSNKTEVDIPIEETVVEIGDDQDLIEVFIEEARELMEQLESAYNRWVKDHNDRTTIDSLKRTLHTMKGSARLAGITPIGNLSHAIESLFIALVDGNLEYDQALVTATRQALDKIANQIDEISNLGKVSTGGSIIDKLNAILNPNITNDEQTSHTSVKNIGQATGIEREESAVVIPFMSEVAKRSGQKEQPNRQIVSSKDQVRINAELMDRLVNDAGEISIYRARLEQQNNVLSYNLSELQQTVTRLKTQLRNLEIETEAQILYGWDREKQSVDQDKADFDPLELDRFSTMQQISRALLETVDDLGDIDESMWELQRETETLLLQQSRISTDLQDGLLRTRMVPFLQLVPRMQRLVRQTAEQMGKKAELAYFGGDGELDRNILNRMVPALEHLLRNAVSHGIEDPQARKQGGKSEIGNISLHIDREATDVLITLTDDGLGLDSNAIRKKAVEKGLISKGANITDEDLYQYVFNPGFSTAKQVTQISGRGVGLDVVSSEVKQLGGSVDIASESGKGTRFTIRLPLTLAITDALLVRVGEEFYAIPHGSVEAVVRIRNKDLRAFQAGDRKLFKYAGHDYQLAYMGKLLENSQFEIPEATNWFPLLLVKAGEHFMAIHADELLGNRQIVVKSVGKQIGSVRWITGGTILVDGTVALILDVLALVRQVATKSAPAKKATGVVSIRPSERLKVMVVDDSITVRKVTGRLLERNNMEVITAKDGVDAIAVLQEQTPDIMLLDIEMPRMDGFDLARHINNSADYNNLPIIMISSRVGDKHQQRAFELGVKRFLGKPYQEHDLLKNIREVVEETRAISA